MPTARYRSKAFEIDAGQWNRDGDHPAVKFVPGASARGTGFEVFGRQGWASVSPGDWIIKEATGDGYYPCAPDVFAAKYELVSIHPMPPIKSDYTPTGETAGLRIGEGEPQSQADLDKLPQTAEGQEKFSHNITMQRAGDVVARNHGGLQGAQIGQNAPRIVQMPSVGRIVHFYSADPNEMIGGISGGGTVCAAIITAVFDGHPDQAVNLSVWQPDGGGPFPFASVPLRDKSAGGPRWWAWPEYVPAKLAAS